MDINIVQIMGNVGKDPECKTMNNGDLMARFSMATSFKTKDKEYTEWHNVVCFDPRLADIIQKYVHKGSRIQIFGEIRTRKYEKDGTDRYITEIVIPKFQGRLLLIGKSDGGGGTQEAQPSSSQGGDDGFDDDIPF